MNEGKNTFSWQFLGNAALCHVLQKKITQGKIAHAYLFWGHEHTGKKTLVDYFITSLLCFSESTQKTGFPCGHCRQCEQYQKRVHPDIVFLRREKDEKTEKTKKNISIKQVRQLISQLETGVFLGSYKIGVIYDAETMSIEAANSLLKTLEEPHSRVIIILLANNKSALPSTILSRCQSYKVKEATHDEIYQHLKTQGIDASSAKIFSNLSGGNVGEALRMSRDQSIFRQHQDIIQSFISISKNNISFRLTHAEQFLSDSADHQEAVLHLESVFDKWQTALRDILLIKNMHADENIIQNSWYFDPLADVAVNFSNEKLISLIQYLEDAKGKLRKNMNHKIILDNFLLYL